MSTRTMGVVCALALATRARKVEPDELWRSDVLQPGQTTTSLPLPVRKARNHAIALLLEHGWSTVDVAMVFDLRNTASVRAAQQRHLGSVGLGGAA